MIKKWSITIPELTGKETRNAYVYVPDSWLRNRKQRFPVLYMFDGHNVFYDEDATYGKSWGMLEYMQKTQTPMIIAAVECNHGPNHDRLKEYAPYSFDDEGLGHIEGKGHITMKWLTRVFKPMVDRKFPTLPDREHTFIAGSSMGGLMSLYAITKFNRYFSRAACLSPSIWFGPEKLDRILMQSAISPNTVVYMDYGAKELPNHKSMRRQFRRVASRLLDRDIMLTCRIIPGGDHSEASWEKQIPFFMNTLLYGLEDS